MASTDLIRGIAIGGLLGAGLAILCAPKSGKETREQIRNSGQKALQKAKAQYEEAARKIESLKMPSKEMLADKKNRLKRAVDAGVEAYRKEAVAKEEGGCMTGIYGDNSLI